MASNYNIMANYIVSKYIERVSGKDLGETFVDDDPSKRVMVGMLSEDRVEAKFEGGYVENTNTRFDSIPCWIRNSYQFIEERSIWKKKD